MRHLYVYFFAKLQWINCFITIFAAYEYSKKRKTCKSAGFNVFFYSAKNFNTSCCLVYIYLKLRRSVVADVSCAEKRVYITIKGREGERHCESSQCAYSQTCWNGSAKTSNVKSRKGEVCVIKGGRFFCELWKSCFVVDTYNTVNRRKSFLNMFFFWSYL